MLARSSDWTRDWIFNRAPPERSGISQECESVVRNKSPTNVTDDRHHRRRTSPTSWSPIHSYRTSTVDVVNKRCLSYCTDLPYHTFFHNLSSTWWSLRLLSLLPVRLAQRPTMFPTSRRFLDEVCLEPRLVLPPCSWEIGRLWLTMMSSLHCTLALG